MKILVTGSKGVIGKKLVEELKRKGHEVFGIDLFHAEGEAGYSQIVSHEQYSYERCDISEFRQLERLFIHNSFNMVYNCAAEFGRWNGEDYYEQLWKTNVIGLKHLLTLQERYKYKLVHFSSSEVYGDYNETMFESVIDTHPIKQLNDYALTKRVNELQIENSSGETVIVRLFNTYGVGETYHPYRSVNAKFCYHALKGLPITVFRGHTRTSLYIDDCIRTLGNISDNFMNGRIYNISGKEEHSIGHLADIIWKITGADTSLIKLANREKQTTKDKHVNSDLAIKELDHKPEVDLITGVKKTIEWMK